MPVFWAFVDKGVRCYWGIAGRAVHIARGGEDELAYFCTTVYTHVCAQAQGDDDDEPAVSPVGPRLQKPGFNLWL